MSRFAKPKSTKRGDDSSETCSDIVPYEGCLPPIGNIVLEGFPPPSTCTRSSKRPIVGKPRPSTPRTSMDDSPSHRTRGSKRKTSPPPPSAITERRTPTPQKGVTSAGASQIGSTSPATPSIISASDPFVALSQVVKDGSSLVVTPSSIPRSTTRILDMDLSSDDGSEEALEASEDELVTKKRISNSDKEGEHETKAMGICLLSLKALLFLFFPSFPVFNF
ncbi:hypothetical protein SO802_012854 [Lithocarpus litseifolius]|uniref:Uncharacterized protein n=1 Tax=Lithocarpus litseifolius TaxID=425828 RepID=A0AAW2D6H4_9ROSI